MHCEVNSEFVSPLLADLHTTRRVSSGLCNGDAMVTIREGVNFFFKVWYSAYVILVQIRIQSF